MKILPIFLLAILVSGCATQHGYWYNPNRSPAQARQDSLQCEGEASEAVRYQHGLSLWGFKAKGGATEDKRITVVDEYARRMKDRGYTFVETK